MREKAMAAHSCTLAWKIPWTEEPGRLSPWGREESDATERLQFHFSLSCIGEGNGNPLQLSWLENPRDRSLVGCCLWDRTWLTWLSSSSSSSVSNLLRTHTHSIKGESATERLVIALLNKDTPFFLWHIHIYSSNFTMLNLTHYSNFYIFTILEFKYFIFIRAEWASIDRLQR